MLKTEGKVKKKGGEKKLMWDRKNPGRGEAKNRPHSHPLGERWSCGHSLSKGKREKKGKKKTNYRTKRGDAKKEKTGKGKKQSGSKSGKRSVIPLPSGKPKKGQGKRETTQRAMENEGCGRQGTTRRKKRPKPNHPENGEPGEQKVRWSEVGNCAARIIRSENTEVDAKS